MNNKERILRPAVRLRGGVRLPHLKNTAECETVVMPPPETVCIPMLQHIGAPAEPAVAVGDKVYVGTLIGRATGKVSADVHSSVSGTVTAFEARKSGDREVTYAVIKSDGQGTPEPSLKPFEVNCRADVAAAARACGLVGLGGAGFPTGVKLDFGEDTKIDTLIINGAECEPYITSDYRECMENYGDVIEGIYLLKEKLGVERVIICIEANKERAISKLYSIAADRRDVDDSVKLMKLPASYPQGAERVIIYSATGRRVPQGKLPSDVGCVVMNITSVAALYRFITTGMPLVSKRITVDGTAVTAPANVNVPIGTSVREVLEFVGGTCEEAAEIIMGGPMMGTDTYTSETVIEKRTNAVTVMLEAKAAPEVSPCIHCNRCSQVCPMRLYPAAVEAALNHGLKERILTLNADYCMECGCCAYTCPAGRPLTQVMRLAKAELRRQKIK